VGQRSLRILYETLKSEEVHRNEYRDLAEARSEIRDFLEKVYNRKRLHSALGYVPPAEFEANLVAQLQKEAAARQLSNEFFQASGNLSIRCIQLVRERRTRRPRPHRLR